MELEQLMWMQFQRDQQQRQQQAAVAAAGASGRSTGGGYPHGYPHRQQMQQPPAGWPANPAGPYVQQQYFPSQPVRVGVGVDVTAKPAEKGKPPPAYQAPPPPPMPKENSCKTHAPRKKRAPARVRTPPPSSGSTASLSPATNPKNASSNVPPLELPTSQGEGTTVLGAACEGEGEENDERRLAQRQKQINFGKVTDGYRYYRLAVPHCQRQWENPKHPVTPRITMKCSKRRWDTLVAAWRRALHAWDEQPRPITMQLQGAPTLEQMGKAKYCPLDVYVQETEKELATVKHAVQHMQDSKNASSEYPGDVQSEHGSSSDPDSKEPVRVVATSVLSNQLQQRESAIGTTTLGGSLEPMVSDPAVLPYVPSPIEPTPGTLEGRTMSAEDITLADMAMSPAGQVPPGCPPLGSFIMLRVVQRRSDGEEIERVLTVSSAGGREGIHSELKKKLRSDLSNVFFRMNGSTGAVSPSSSLTSAQQPSPPGTLSVSPRTAGLAKPQPLTATSSEPSPKKPVPTKSNTTTAAASPEAESPPPPPATPARPTSGSSRQQVLYLDSIEHLQLLLQQRFAPTLYYVSDEQLPEDDLDVQRELQMTPIRSLYANCEQLFGGLIFSHTAAAGVYTPNPHNKASTLSPTHFYDGSGISPLFLSQQRGDSTGSVGRPPGLRQASPLNGNSPYSNP